MSHRATNWAIEQRGLKPVTKIILWHLADCHNPDKGGSFPTIDFLADRCEVSRASVMRHLDELEERGLIRRKKRVNEQTKRQEASRYFLAFEPGFEPLDVVSRVANCDPETAPSRVAETGEAESQSSDTQTCKGTYIPPKPPLAETSAEGVDSGEKPVENPPPPLPPELGTLIARWPASRLGNPDKARRAWEGLTAGDRNAALLQAEKTAKTLAGLRLPVPKLSGYLAERAWLEFADAPPVEDGHYRITPGRPEWEPWLRWIGRTFSPARIESTRKLGFFLPATRWPPGHAKATPPATERRH